MNTFLSLLPHALPALILAFAAIYLFHEGTRFIQKRDENSARLQHAKGTGTAKSIPEVELKLMLNAAERFTLYLERIAPDRLVMRLHQNGMTARMLENEILRTIREEFDHNLSQQIYISEAAWELIKTAKEEMIKFISAMGEKMNEQRTGLDLSRKIFEAASRVDQLPGDVALRYLRKETRLLLMGEFHRA